MSLSPLTQISLTLKYCLWFFQAIISDVIDIDSDDDSADSVSIGEIIGGNSKGKVIDAVCNGFW